MEKDDLKLIPRDRVYAEAERYNDELHRSGVAIMQKDITDAVNEAYEKAKNTGKVFFNEDLVIPHMFIDGHGQYYIPVEVVEWAGNAGYKLQQGTGKRYFIQ